MELELTPRDVAHWPQETRVLVDAALERAAIEDWSFRTPDASKIALYRLLYDGEPFMWGADWEYGDREGRYVGQEKNPLVGIEEFDLKQRLVPVAVPGAMTIVISTPRDFRHGDWVYVNSERFGAGELVESRWVSHVDLERRTITLSTPAHDLVRAIPGERPTPPPTRSRVPPHVAARRRRLDGRRAS